jgi:hypothetical protein
MAYTPHSTFGATLHVYNTTTAAYVAIGGFTGTGDVPKLMVDSVLDVTNHGSSGGVEEKIVNGKLKWSGPLVIDLNEDSDAGAITDAGQAYLIANVGATKKIKLTLAGITTALAWNCIIESVVQGPRPLSGVATLRVTLIPTGAAATP